MVERILYGSAGRGDTGGVACRHAFGELHESLSCRGLAGRWNGRGRIESDGTGGDRGIPAERGNLHGGGGKVIATERRVRGGAFVVGARDYSSERVRG